MSLSIRINTSGNESSYDAAFGKGLDACGHWARKCLGKSSSKICLVSDANVSKLYAGTVESALQAQGFSVSQHIVRPGERAKSISSLTKTLDALGTAELTRSDAVVALGGGVVGDLAGFAASIYQRGIRFLQVPTSLLAMVDSSVGGKTGVNSKFGKNTIGAFHQPSGVLIVPAVLSTLPRREMTAGLCEMVKHAAISGTELMDKTELYLETHDDLLLEELIADNIAFKAKIVRGDEREAPERRDGRSRMVLNFGHTLAHALEKVTNYRYFRHGEAVGYGILYAAELSKSLDLLSNAEVNLLYGVVHRVGILPTLANIDADEVIRTFVLDKKNVAGGLRLVLLNGIGDPCIVDGKDISRRTQRSAFEHLLAR